MLAQSLRFQVHWFAVHTLTNYHICKFAGVLKSHLKPWKSAATQSMSLIVKHIFKEIGNERPTNRLDCGHHRRRSCRLACRAVHEKPNGPCDEHRPWH